MTLARIFHDERGLARARACGLRSGGLDAAAAAQGTDLATCAPKRLRYRYYHVAGGIARRGRAVRLGLPRRWPWAQTFAAAFARLQALPSG
jgi:hypothetical protein